MDESSVSLKATCGKILSRFEQNLMELASLPPQHIKCRTVSRMDSDDEKEEAPKGKPVRKQSRISNVVRPTGMFF
ncbi:hypothetical protein AB6A40_003391 [Gnathostoma spinigerum]|uniref:Uncharacterized protein n=1 Tax=Gnathostoma spinigerum TaxID=75299 RepID=A0ABD6EJ27_9BILA